jgi:hypothetical protein
VNERVAEAFLMELRTQCDFVLGAARFLEAEVRGEREGRSTAIWYHAQAFVIAAAMISKLLWGTTGRPRTELLEVLGVDDGSPLKNRAVRNSFEHIDERLERFLERNPHGNLTVRMLGSRDAFNITDSPEMGWFHQIDWQELTIRFGDATLDIQGVVTATERLLAAIPSRL